MNWRYIPFRRYDPYFKTGLNSALIESVSGAGDPVVFLAGWEKNCINLGYSQRVDERVKMEEFERREDVVLVRRQGGGGTTYLTRDGEITWHIVAPPAYFPDDVNQIYGKVCGKIAEGLEKIGIEARHEPVNDIVTDNGKISGATIKQKDGATYVAGTLLYRVNPEEMFSLIKPEEKKKKDRQIQDYRERVTSVEKETDSSHKDTRMALRKIFLEGKNYREDEWTDSEIERAETLGNKYSSKEWIYRE